MIIRSDTGSIGFSPNYLIAMRTEVFDKLGNKLFFRSFDTKTRGGIEVIFAPDGSTQLELNHKTTHNDFFIDKIMNPTDSQILELLFNA